MKTNHERNNDAALAAYAAAQVKTRDALARIATALDAHQDRQPPEAIHWGHAGDLNHVRALLNEVAAFLGSGLPID